MIYRIAGIDTRSPDKDSPGKGTMNGMITTDGSSVVGEVIERLKAYKTGKVVEKVTCRRRPAFWEQGRGLHFWISAPKRYCPEP